MSTAPRGGRHKTRAASPLASTSVLFVVRVNELRAGQEPASASISGRKAARAARVARA